MKIELKHKNLPMDEVFAFMIDGGIGFISKDSKNFIIFWDVDECPSVYPIRDTSESDLKDSLLVSGIIGKEVEILNTWGMDDFKLVFREI